jgi:hypothetical protein
MKIFLLPVFILYSVLLFGQPKDEYMILRVNHVLKQQGVESRLFVDLGTTGEHSMKGIIENTDAGSVIINSAEGTATAIKNEVDFLNIIYRYGFTLKESYSIDISGKSYVQFVFVKKTG